MLSTHRISVVLIYQESPAVSVKKKICITRHNVVTIHGYSSIKNIWLVIWGGVEEVHLTGLAVGGGYKKERIELCDESFQEVKEIYIK